MGKIYAAILFNPCYNNSLCFLCRTTAKFYRHKKIFAIRRDIILLGNYFYDKIKGRMIHRMKSSVLYNWWHMPPVIPASIYQIFLTGVVQFVWTPQLCVPELSQVTLSWQLVMVKKVPFGDAFVAIAPVIATTNAAIIANFLLIKLDAFIKKAIKWMIHDAYSFIKVFGFSFPG